MAQQQTPNCHDDVYTTVEDTTSGISYCEFLTDQLKPDCVADSCSRLKNSDLCPTKYDGSLNLDNIKTTLSIVKECIATLPTMCDKPLHLIPFPNFTVNVDQLLKGTSLTGNCGTIGVDNYMYNISNAEIELADGNVQGSQFSVVTKITNLNMVGFVGCHFQTDILQLVLGKPLTFNFDNYTFSLNFAIDGSFLIDLSSTEFEPNVQSANCDVQFSIGNFDFGVFNYLFSGVTSIFSSLAQSYLQSSIIKQGYVKFINSIVGNAFAYTKKNCP
ncbi:hypothetical protein CHUAL_006493 [Chamberlinius hualienensis]